MDNSFDTLAAQAQAAIEQGADPQWVQTMFASEVSRMGGDPSKIVFASNGPTPTPAPKLDSTTKEDYRDAVQPPVVQGLLAGNKEANSPVGGNFDDVDAGSATSAPRDWGDEATYAVEGATKRGIAGVMGLANGIAPLLNPMLQPDDSVFQAADKLREAGDADLAKSVDRTVNGKAKGSAQIAGGLLSGLNPINMLGEQFNAGAEAIQNGGDLQDAELASAKQSLINEATVGAGLLGKQGAGLVPYLTRAGSQGAANVGITAVEKTLDGDSLDATDVATSLGMGAFGGLFRNERPIKEKAPTSDRPIPETGDKAFDAGVGHATKAGNLTPEDVKASFEDIGSKGQMDLELPSQKETDAQVEDLFSGNKQDAETAELKRVLGSNFPTERSPMQQRMVENVAEREGRLPSRQDAAPEQAPQTDLFGMPTDVPTQAEMNLPQADEMSLYQQRKQRLAEEQTRIQPDASVPEEEMEKSPDLDSALQAAQQRRAALGAADGMHADEMHLPLGDELPYTRAPGGGFFAKDEVKPATDEQMAPFLSHNPMVNSAMERVHDWINKKGNAWDVLIGIKNLPDHLQSVVDKLASNPYAKQVLKDVGIKAVGVDDFKTSTSGLEHSVRPILGSRKGQLVSTGHLGAFDSDYNRIVLRGKGFKANGTGDHGLNTKTIIHEIMHGFTKHIIDGVQDGTIQEPRARRAVSELDSVRKALSDHKDMLTKDVPKAVAKDFEYGLTDNHELMSVFYTDKAARSVLDRISVKGLSALSRIKNAVMDMMGLSKKADRSVADQLFESGDNILRYNPQEGHGIPGLEQVAPRERVAAAGGEEELEPKPRPLQAPRNVPTQILREGLSSKGLEPRVTLAKRTREGETALGRAEAIQAANRINSIVSSDNKSDVAAALNGDVDALSRLGPRAKEVVSNEIKANYDRSIAIVREGMKDPNLDIKKKNILAKILDNAGKYQMHITEAREVPGSMNSKYELYKQATNKFAANKPLNARELKAYNSVTVAKKYLSDYWMPSADALKDMGAARLEELYKYYTGKTADEQFLNMTKDQRRIGMEAGIRNKMRNTMGSAGELDNLLKASMGIEQDKNSLRQYYNNMRSPSDVYSTLQDVPAALQQLWDPITQPAARVAASVQAQHNYIATLKAQNQLRDTGLNGGKAAIFTDKRGSSTHTQQISGTKFGPLQDLWTTPDVKRAMDSVFTMNNLSAKLLDSMVADNNGTNMLINLAGKGLRTVKGVASWTKLMSVVGNLGNYANNFVGSGMQALSNGNASGNAWRRGLKTIAESIGTSSKTKMSDDLKDMYRYHLLEYSHIQELQGTEQGNIIASLMKQASEATNPLEVWKKGIQKATNAGRKTIQAGKELYGAMDLWTKAANWHKEVDFWTDYAKRNNTGETIEQIKQKVAERINDTNITPSLAPKLVRGAEQLGITRFMTYYTEIARTMKNNVAYGAQDVFHGINKGDVRLMSHGFDRLMGTAIAAGGTSKMAVGFAKGIAAAVGLTATQLSDDDPRKKYMDKDAFLSAQQPLMLSDPEHPEAGEYMYDMSRPDPYAPITGPLREMFEATQALANGDKDAAKTKAEAAYDQIKGLFAHNTMWSGMARFAEGKKPRLATENPEQYNQAMKFMTEKLGLSVDSANGIMSSAEPAIPGTAKNILYAQGAKSDKLGIATAAGIGVSKLDIADDVSNYLGGKAKDDISKAKNSYLSLMKQNYESSPERMETEFKKSLKAAADPYEKLQLAVNAARAQGATRNQMLKRLDAAGVTKDMAYTIIRNKPITTDVLAGDLGKDLDKDLIQADGDADAKHEAKQRYRDNTKLMNKLLKKYKHTSIEDLDNA